VRKARRSKCLGYQDGQHTSYLAGLSSAYTCVAISSNHPSQQNTSTGKFPEKMLLDVFRHTRKAAGLL
jgi:uracil-DNA glycosylase